MLLRNQCIEYLSLFHRQTTWYLWRKVFAKLVYIEKTIMMTVFKWNLSAFLWRRRQRPFSRIRQELKGRVDDTNNDEILYVDSLSKKDDEEEGDQWSSCNFNLFVSISLSVSVFQYLLLLPPSREEYSASLRTSLTIIQEKRDKIDRRLSFGIFDHHLTDMISDHCFTCLLLKELRLNDTQGEESVYFFLQEVLCYRTKMSLSRWDFLFILLPLFFQFLSLFLTPFLTPFLTLFLSLFLTLRSFTTFFLLTNAGWRVCLSLRSFFRSHWCNQSLRHWIQD